MNFKKLILPLLFLGFFFGCSKDDFKPNVPSLKDYDSESYSSLYLKQNKVLSLDGNHSVRSVHVDGDLLYVTNKTAKQVETYSLADFSRQPLSYGSGGLDCCGGYAVDSLVFVTSTNNPCQVSVFHKSTGEYYCRLGDGGWGSGIVVHPYSVAANSRYVFVWTQGAVKIFKRANMTPGKSMYVWATLDTENITGYNNNYSGLTIDGDTCLYVLAGDRGKVMYTYHIPDEIESNSKLPFVKKNVLPSAKPYGLAFGNKYVYASLTVGNQNELRLYEKEKFVADPDLTAPLLTYYNFPDGTPFNFNRTLTAKGDTIYLPQSQNKVYELILCAAPLDVIIPSDK